MFIRSGPFVAYLSSHIKTYWIKKQSNLNLIHQFKGFAILLVLLFVLFIYLYDLLKIDFLLLLIKFFFVGSYNYLVYAKYLNFSTPGVATLAISTFYLRMQKITRGSGSSMPIHPLLLQPKERIWKQPGVGP